MVKNNIPEEVTITPVIRDIERLVLRFLNLLKTIFIGIGNALLSFIRFSIKHYVLLGLATAIGLIFGIVITNLTPQQYESFMVLRLNVNSSTQLCNDVDFFNSLIKKSKHQKLAELLNINVQQAASLRDMGAIPFSTTLERMQVINNLMESIDSSISKKIDIQQTIDNDKEINLHYSIVIKGTDPEAFRLLEPSLINYFESHIELREKKENKIKLLENEKSYYVKLLDDLDTLKKIHNKSMLLRARHTSNSQTTISLSPQSQQESFNIHDMYKLSANYISSISEIETQLVDLKTCYSINAHFSAYGIDSGIGSSAYTAILGGLGFLLMSIFIGISKMARPSQKGNE